MTPQELWNDLMDRKERNTERMIGKREMPFEPIEAYAELKADTWGVEHESKSGRWESKNIKISKGTTVRIVMVSRLGDVGITMNLEAENGYCRRIQCVDDDPDSVEEDLLENIRWSQSG